MKKTIIVLAAAALFCACGSPESAPVAGEAKAPAELTGDDFVAMGKAGLSNLSEGNIDAWMESFADNAVYRWNNGDSLAGKAAITEYWKNRRSNDLTAITFSNDIWLSLKVNQPQNEFAAPGQWLMSWYMVNATYKTGKSMTQWIHTDMHINDAGKVDILIQYVDRVPIMQAMTP